jgi:hypothetical protein
MNDYKLIHTSSGSKIEYEKVGKERTMSEQERGADIAAERMPLPKALTETDDFKQRYDKAFNSIKDLATEVGKTCDALEMDIPAIDKRWLAIARTNLQQGFMAMVRSIAKPETF